MKAPIAYLLLLLLAVPSFAKDVDLQYQFAAISLKKSKNAEIKILSLPEELRDAAIMNAAGLLNLKLMEWGKQKLAEGEITKWQFYHIMSISMFQLAGLTQQANWYEATNCHISEASRLIEMAKEISSVPVNCRSAVYGPKQAAGVRLGSKLREAATAESINTWTTETIMFSLQISEAEAMP